MPHPPTKTFTNSFPAQETLYQNGTGPRKAFVLRRYAPVLIVLLWQRKKWHSLHPNNGGWEGGPSTSGVYPKRRPTKARGLLGPSAVQGIRPANIKAVLTPNSEDRSL